MDDGPVTIISNPFMRAGLIQLQKEDSGVCTLFDAAEWPDSDYMIADDILYAINKAPASEENAFKIVVPVGLRKKILALGHGKSGNFRSKKTRKHIKAHFYWPGIGKAVHDYCKSCKT